MDHLPVPHQRKALENQLKFPLRCDPNAFDNGPLETYPERRGFRLNYWSDYNFANNLTPPDGSRPSIEQSTALLQEWLFFGFLSETHTIYGSEFNGYDYVKSVNGANFLTMEKLPTHASLWDGLEKKRPKAEQRQHFRTLQEHSMRALRFLSNNFTAVSHGSISPDGALDNVVREESRLIVEFGLDILLMVIGEATDCISRTIYFGDQTKRSGADPISLSMQQWMKSGDWCPSELNLMGLTFDHSTFCFANTVARGSGQNVDHSECNAVKCLAFDVKTSEYVTAHADGCYGCQNLTIDPAELEDFLLGPEHDGIIRVQINFSGDGEVSIAFTSTGNYIAISHVWSDGLGHPPGINALPQCQLRRLRHLVLAAGSPKAIVWIDALCVPAQRGRAKTRALAQMAAVYRGSTNVLVLDSDLLSMPSSSSNEEILLRLSLCKWMRRLWTLEEGVVARSKLLFQFADKALSMPAPRSSIAHKIAANCAALIAQYLPQDADIVSVITSLQFRSTTNIADEPLCIGYIVDIDVTSIITIHDQFQRMAQLYTLLAQKEPKFPWQLLFTNERKLDISPFRWAPASLLYLSPKDVFYIQGMFDSADNGITATQTTRGLQFQCPHSCILSFPEDAPINKCMILRIDALSYVLCPVPVGGNCRTHGRFWDGPNKDRCLNTDPLQDWTATWAAQYKYRPTGHWGLIMSKSGPGYGMMVAINEATNKMIHATIVGQVHMYELRTESSMIIAGFNKEHWNELGAPARDEGEIQSQQQLAEQEVFDDRYYSWVNCEARVNEHITWCIG